MNVGKKVENTELLNLLKEVESCENIRNKDMTQWVDVNKNYRGSQHLTEDEIVDQSLKPTVIEGKSDETYQTRR